jgi:universal stress protein E
MNKTKTRLFVVIDPTENHQLALIKASLIAKLGDCHIHAFLCIYQDMDEGGAYASRRDFKRQTLSKAKTWLDELMQPCKLSGLSYTTEVVWNSRWVECLTRSIEKSACDLVIKSSFHHTRARRFFSKTSDYHLMHNCACPILFTHQDQEWKSDRIQHARLNNVIMRDARAFAEIVGLDLYIGCAYVNSIDGEHLAIETRGHEVGREQLGKLYRLAPDRVMLQQGSVVEALQAICEETNPSIVIIGTLARTGIRGKLIGNTAEKLLDVVDADLLTVN